MQDLLNAIKTDAETNLAYLQWVGVIEHESLMPDAPSFPILCLIEGGITRQSLPGKKDLETLSVGFVAYQQIMLDEPGGAIMGSEAQLGDTGKGLLAIGADLKTRFNDNTLGQPKIHYAHIDRDQPSRVIVSKDGEALAVYKRFDFSYRRYV